MPHTGTRSFSWLGGELCTWINYDKLPLMLDHWINDAVLYFFGHFLFFVFKTLIYSTYGAQFVGELDDDSKEWQVILFAIIFLVLGSVLTYYSTHQPLLFLCFEIWIAVSSIFYQIAFLTPKASETSPGNYDTWLDTMNQRFANFVMTFIQLKHPMLKFLYVGFSFFSSIPSTWKEPSDTLGSIAILANPTVFVLLFVFFQSQRDHNLLQKLWNDVKSGEIETDVYCSTFDTLDEPITTIDVDGYICYANPAFEQMCSRFYSTKGSSGREQDRVKFSALKQYIELRVNTMRVSTKILHAFEEKPYTFSLDAQKSAINLTVGSNHTTKTELEQFDSLYDVLEHWAKCFKIIKYYIKKEWPQNEPFEVECTFRNDDNKDEPIPITVWLHVTKFGNMDAIVCRFSNPLKFQAQNEEKTKMKHLNTVTKLLHQEIAATFDYVVVMVQGLINAHQLQTSAIEEFLRPIISIVQLAKWRIADVNCYSDYMNNALRSVLSDCDIFDVFKDILEPLSYYASQRGKELSAKINPSFPSYVTSDRERLESIIVNLIKNAIKFGKSSKVNVNVAYDKNTAKILVSCADAGEGLPPKVDKQFQKLLKKGNRWKVVADVVEKLGYSLGLVLINLQMNLLESGSGFTQTKLIGQHNFELNILARISPKSAYVVKIKTSEDNPITFFQKSNKKLYVLNAGLPSSPKKNNSTLPCPDVILLFIYQTGTNHGLSNLHNLLTSAKIITLHVNLAELDNNSNALSQAIEIIERKVFLKKSRMFVLVSNPSATLDIDGMLTELLRDKIDPSNLNILHLIQRGKPH